MTDRPFSNKYVIRETLRHMQNSISISTAKTVARLPEFEGDQERTAEALFALANLSALNRMIEAIRENNDQILGENK